MRALILFDIDGTLLRTNGAGVAAMADAWAEVFGRPLNTDDLDFAGALDPLVISAIFRRSGEAETAGSVAEFRRVYHDHLERRLVTDSTARVMPGVHALLARLAARGEHQLGLLTGNFAETAGLKLRACGLDPGAFRVCAWGDDSPHDPPAREHLPPVAMRRHAELWGAAPEPASVTIIGDTPHDVRCARMNGCRSLAVATGRFGVAELLSAGADHAVRDLGDTDAIMSWLVPEPADRGRP